MSKFERPLKKFERPLKKVRRFERSLGSRRGAVKVFKVLEVLKDVFVGCYSHEFDPRITWKHGSGFCCDSIYMFLKKQNPPPHESVLSKGLGLCWSWFWLL